VNPTVLNLRYSGGLPPAGGGGMADHEVPQQWAADPSGRHRFRFWDGTRWTGHVYDGPTPPSGPPREPGERMVVDAPGHYEPAAEAEPIEDGDEDAPRSRRSRGGGRAGADPMRAQFWKGAAAGGAVMAVIAIIANVALGGGDADVSTTSTTKDKTTTTTAAVTTTIAPPTTLAPGRPASEVRVIVLNGSGKGGAASTLQAELKTKGYQVPSIGNADVVQGTTVGCRAGFEAEAAQLAVVVGTGAVVGAFPNPEPAGASEADCVVTIGTT